MTPDESADPIARAGNDRTFADLGLSRPGQRIHVVGIGGAGMGAIAEVLVGMGHLVSGSDRNANAMTERLATAGIAITVGHAPGVAARADLLTASTAVPAGDADVVAARANGVPVLRRAEMLAAICAVRPTIAVGGTHGKTTTSSILALALEACGMDPSFVIGGTVTQLGTGARWASGDLFVVEADESDGTFVELPRHGAIVTNVEPDHIEHHGTFERLVELFGRFVSATTGPVVICGDDPRAAELAQLHDPAAVTYGLAEGVDLRLVDVRDGRHGISWRLIGTGIDVALEMPVPGIHNALNASAAASMALQLGGQPDDIATGIAGYQGVARRYEPRGTAGGVTFIDDYAHLPGEIEAALRTAAAGEHSRIVCVFQPHRYSRTEALWRTFGDCFDAADVLVVAGIYSSGEAPRPGVSSQLIVDAVRGGRPPKTMLLAEDRDDLIDTVSALLRPGDLCLTLGAGDLTTLPPAVMARRGGATP